MNRQQFEYYLHSPADLSASQLTDLEDLSQAFPYCQTLRLMIAKALSRDENLHFQSYLRLAAAYATDRKRLKLLILSETEWPVTEDAVAGEPAHGIPQEILDQKVIDNGAKEAIPDYERFRQLIAEMEQTIQDLKAQRERSAVVYDIEREFGTVEKQTAISETGEATPPAGDLIEQFIHDESRPKQPKSPFFDPTEIARKSVIEHDDLATETLAQIYTEQGYYQRAIKIYQQLILKFPEKSSYFAAQIKNLEKEAGKY